MNRISFVGVFALALVVSTVSSAAGYRECFHSLNLEPELGGEYVRAVDAAGHPIVDKQGRPQLQFDRDVALPARKNGKPGFYYFSDTGAYFVDLSPFKNPANPLRINTSQVRFTIPGLNGQPRKIRLSIGGFWMTAAGQPKNAIDFHPRDLTQLAARPDSAFVAASVEYSPTVDAGLALDSFLGQAIDAQTQNVQKLFPLSRETLFALGDTHPAKPLFTRVGVTDPKILAQIKAKGREASMALEGSYFDNTANILHDNDKLMKGYVQRIQPCLKVGQNVKTQAGYANFMLPYVLKLDQRVEPRFEMALLQDLPPFIDKEPAAAFQDPEDRLAGDIQQFITGKVLAARAEVNAEMMQQSKPAASPPELAHNPTQPANHHS
jgi:hypothetical protein